MPNWSRSSRTLPGHPQWPRRSDRFIAATTYRANKEVGDGRIGAVERGGGLPRTVVLEGATNIRDVGGAQAGDGRCVRFGVVYRGASLAKLSDGDLATLAALGLRTVCDPRGRDEMAQAPSRAAGMAGVTVHELPIAPTVGASLRDILAVRDITGEDALALLRRAYVAYALDWAGSYRRIFDLLLAGAAPLLFHCTAGKDRTGFGAALLLTALGVPYEAVRADYLATNRLWQPDPAVVGRFPPGVADVLLRAHPGLLDAAFAAAVEDCGSMDGYLERRIGLTDEARTRLRALLLA